MNPREAREHLSLALARHIDAREPFGVTRELHRRARELVARCRNATGIGNDRAVKARLDDLADCLDDVTSQHASAGALFAQAQSATRSAAAALTTEASQ